MVMLDTIDGLPPLAREALKQIGVEAETAGELSDADAVQQLQACLGLLKCTQEELPAHCEAGCLQLSTSAMRGTKAETRQSVVAIWTLLC
jgi:hypothetical protein